MLAVCGALRVRVENTDGNSELLIDDPNRFGEIGVVGDDDELIAVFAKGVDEHVRRDVDVGAFLFHLDHFYGVGTAGRW